MCFLVAIEIACFSGVHDKLKKHVHLHSKFKENSGFGIVDYMLSVITKLP